MLSQTHFILNDQEIRTAESPGRLVLDFLRRRKRLIGTKEGCREGDCGACVVLIGEFEGDNIKYKPVTSCLMPVGELHGKHLVTIEGLNLEGLNPAQEAIVIEGGTQCGFCTPGIVVSMTGYLMEKGIEITHEGIKKALSGHLCRCTGYRSLKRANIHLKKSVGKHTGNEAMIENRMLPSYFKEIPDRLRKIPRAESPNGHKMPECFIAGGTDLYVQKGYELPDSKVTVLNLLPEMKQIKRVNGHLNIGALTTFEEFAENSEIIKMIPDIGSYMFLNASWQIRNRATLGGNIINASPIGDMTILLLALESQLIFKDQSKERIVPMTSFYKGYKDLDRSPTEILTQIRIPVPSSGTSIHFEKVSKRKCLDIASVNCTIRIRCDEGVISDIGLAFGGVAPIPFFMRKTCEYFIGKPVSADVIKEAFPIIQDEIAPITDIRGSAGYKRLLARQLLIAGFAKIYPEQVNAMELI